MHGLEVQKALNDKFAMKELVKKQIETGRLLRILKKDGFILIPIAAQDPPSKKKA